MIVAIVLSAGESSRMGSPKALLSVAGKSFIERVISALRATGVGKIIVVLGHQPEPIRARIEGLGVEIVINKDYQRGQLSSLIAGLKSLEGQEVDGALVHLVDHPFLDPSTIDRMIDLFYRSNKLIVLPRYRGRRGHPVLFSSRLFAELMSAPLDQGAKSVVHAHRDETLELETENEGVIIDIDTPEEYRQHQGRK